MNCTRTVFGLSVCVLVSLTVCPIWAIPPSTSYRLGPGDVLQITVADHPGVTFAGQDAVQIRPDGKFSYPYASEVTAEGKPVAEGLADVQATVVRRQVIEQQLSEQDRFRLRDSTTQSNPVVRQLEIGLAKLEQKRTGLLEEYVPESSKVQAVDAQIESVKQQISGMLRTVLAATTEEANPVRDTLLVDAASNRAAELAASSRVDALKQTISQIEAQLSAVPQ